MQNIHTKENSFQNFMSILRVRTLQAITSYSIFSTTFFPASFLRSHIPNSFHLRKSHALLNLRNGQSGVESLGARPRAVENSVATIQTHRIVERLLALLGLLVSGISEPAVRLEENGRAEVLLAVPPV